MHVDKSGSGKGGKVVEGELASCRHRGAEFRTGDGEGGGDCAVTDQRKGRWSRPSERHIRWKHKPKSLTSGARYPVCVMRFPKKGSRRKTRRRTLDASSQMVFTRAAPFSFLEISEGDRVLHQVRRRPQHRPRRARSGDPRRGRADQRVTARRVRSRSTPPPRGAPPLTAPRAGERREC